MPKSKSKRSRYVPPPPPRPKPSPRWVPVAFFTFVGLGFAAIMSRYIFSSSIHFFDNNWLLGAGLALIAIAFGIATQWR
jgi:hypothetical protein